MTLNMTMALLSTIVLTGSVANRAPTPRTVPDPEWQTWAPVGVVVDTTCCDIAPGGTHEFDKLKITVLATTFDSTVGNSRGVARMRLTAGGATEEVTAREGTALNWHGYHVAIAAVYRLGELGSGRVALRVVSVASLPQCKGKTWKHRPAPWPCTQSEDRSDPSNR